MRIILNECIDLIYAAKLSKVFLKEWPNRIANDAVIWVAEFSDGTKLTTAIHWNRSGKSITVRQWEEQ